MAAPTTVGTTTDQPISPDMPSPNQTLLVPSRCAYLLRTACDLTSRLNSVSSPLLAGLRSSCMMQLLQAMHEPALHLRQHLTHVLLLEGVRRESADLAMAGTVENSATLRMDYRVRFSLVKQLPTGRLTLALDGAMPISGVDTRKFPSTGIAGFHPLPQPWQQAKLGAKPIAIGIRLRALNPGTQVAVKCCTEMVQFISFHRASTWSCTIASDQSLKVP